MNLKFLILSISASLILTGCKKPDEPPPAPRPALVMTISDEGARTGMTLVGEVKPRYESAQGFRVNGKIIERKVEIGASVKKGQLLVRLDSADANLATQSSIADVSAAEAQLALAKANLERQRQLIEKKFISPAALDSYEAQYKSASARLQQTRAQTSVNANQSRYTALTADRDGIVTDIRAEPGQVVSAGEVIARIIDPAQLEVHIPVPESRISTIAVGDDATMRLWAKREKTYAARIREIAPASDAVTRSFLVKVTLLNPDAEVHLGMTAGVKLSKDDTGAILIPSSAVTQVKGNATVWLVDKNNGKVSPQSVQVGSYREDGALVTAGLKVGDTIVTAGVEALQAGQQVRPVEANQTKQETPHETQQRPVEAGAGLTEKGTASE
ncbi:MAG: efflux RND transporter periplasmic adaptor subunit [Candidatus Methylopumilus sp.]|jgi:RND family efflux transporter MFP subunit